MLSCERVRMGSSPSEDASLLFLPFSSRIMPATEVIAAWLFAAGSGQGAQHRHGCMCGRPSAE